MTLQESRANALLDNVSIRDTDGQVLTRRAFIKKRIAAGWQPVTTDVPDTAAVTKLEKELDYLRRVKWEPSGNPNWPDTRRYHAIKKLLVDGPKKAEYRLVDASGDICTKITKTEFDYALSVAVAKVMQESPKIVTDRTHIGVHSYASNCPACAVREAEPESEMEMERRLR